MELLDRWGYKAWNHNGFPEYLREYQLILVREYERSDFEDVEYLEFWHDPVDSISSCERDEQDRLRLERPTLKKARQHGLDFASATLGETVVLQRLRDLLLDGSFRHLVFNPTVLVTGRGPTPGRYTPIPWEQFKVTQPWWELTSDFVLPPLSPSMDIREWKSGEPFRPADRLVRCSPREGLYNHAELHYRRSDLEKIEPFDVAQTFENFGPSHSPSYNIIVSKRFYDYCMHHGLKGRWAPVRVDPDDASEVHPHA